ncbi:MAG: hypothetical protein WCK42_03325 [Myxococcaceae bacterium]
MDLKAVFFAIFFGGISISGYSYQSESEGIYCPPQGEIYENFRLINGTLVTRSLYASELLRISDSREVSYDWEYDVLVGRTSFDPRAWDKYNGLINFDDGCDRIGALYVAKFFVRLWPGTQEFNEQKEFFRNYIVKSLRCSDLKKPSMLWNACVEAHNLLKENQP